VDPVVSVLSRRVKTLVCNGPFGGPSRWSPFTRHDRDPDMLRRILPPSGKIVSVAGGGDTVAALQRARTTDADDLVYRRPVGAFLLDGWRAAIAWVQVLRQK